MATTYNLTIARGQAIDLEVTIQEDGSAYDVSGLTAAQLEYRAGRKSSPTTINYTIGSGIALTTPASGVVTVSLSGTNTDLTPGKYLHELWIDDGTLDEPVFTGSLTITTSLKHA